MRKSGLLKICLSIVMTMLCLGQGFSCSMYKLTVHGKTIVGNHEDSWRLTSRIWFEKGMNGQFGAAYVGYSDKTHPDGAMNEAGLAFDAFTVPRKPNVAANDPKKKDFSYEGLKTIMQQCATVDEVHSFLEKLNLQALNGSPFFNGGMLLFVDKTGKYLVVETDKLTLGNDHKFVLSNFSFADTKDLNAVKIERYRKGVQFLKNKIDTSISFCTALSDTMSVNRKKIGDGTLYTTIYDLNSGIVHAYFFHDFKKRVSFNLEEELAKGNHGYDFTNLFPDNAGYRRFINYQTPQNNKLIFGFLLFCGMLFFVSFLYFAAGFIKSLRRKGNPKSTFRYTRLGLSLLCLSLCYYASVLIKDQAIFYFPSPYTDGSSSIANLFSYLPLCLLVLVLPLLIANVKVFRSSSWNGFARCLFAFNNVAFLVLTVLFAYWGLFDVFA